MPEKPYICASALQPEHIGPMTAHLLSARKLQSSHDLVLGVAVSAETVANDTRVKTRKVATLAGLADAADQINPDIAKLSVHFDCRDYTQGNDFANLDDLLARYSRPFQADALAAADALDLQKVHSFQLNGTVRPHELAKFKEGIPDTPIIYALGSELVRLGDDAVLAYLDVCRTHLRHVLVDLSAGTGKKATPEQMDHLIGLVRRAAPDVRIGMAGGLGPDNIETEYPSVARRHGPMSMDSETKLRTPGSDVVDPELVRAWLTKSQNAATMVK